MPTEMPTNSFLFGMLISTDQNCGISDANRNVNNINFCWHCLTLTTECNFLSKIALSAEPIPIVQPTEIFLFA